MPEVQEGVISNATVSNAVKSIKIKHGSVENGPYCRSAYGDVTAAEKEQDAKIKSTNPSKGFPSGSNAQLGLPIELKLDNKAVRDLRRGMTGKQTPILFGPELEPPQGYQALQLLEVVTSPRNVILKLGPNLWLQVRPLCSHFLTGVDERLFGRPSYSQPPPSTFTPRMLFTMG